MVGCEDEMKELATQTSSVVTVRHGDRKVLYKPKDKAGFKGGESSNFTCSEIAVYYYIIHLSKQFLNVEENIKLKYKLIKLGTT